MIDTQTVNKIIQDEINKSKDIRVTKALAKIQSRIVNLEENELNDMFEDYMTRKSEAAEASHKEATALFNGFFD